MRAVCSWCGRVVREGEPGQPTTHTLCPRCFQAIAEELDAKANGRQPKTDQADAAAPTDPRD
jgi:hypothetical protein